jgi:hypothetical protein
MKKTLLTLSAIILCAQLFAQKIEVSLEANSGLFHYSGSGAESTTFFLPGENPTAYHMNNPYGKEVAFSYGADIKAQYTSNGGFIAGIDAGYDLLRSKAGITEVHPYYNPLSGFFYLNANFYSVKSKGSGFTQSNEININPYFGYRLKTKKLKIDLMPGVDLAYNLSSSENGQVRGSDGIIYKADYKLPKSPADVRLRFGVALWLSKFGFTASYAHGFTNYASNLDENFNGVAGEQKAMSELIRFGITYRIL